MSISVAVSCRSGSKLATTLVDCYFQHSFLFLFSQKKCSDQKLIWQKFSERQIIQGQTPSAILGPPSVHFGFPRRCGIAGGERVPPSPLGWYTFYMLWPQLKLIYQEYFFLGHPLLWGREPSISQNSLLLSYGRILYIHSKNWLAKLQCKSHDYSRSSYLFV